MMPLLLIAMVITAGLVPKLVPETAHKSQDSVYIEEGEGRASGEETLKESQIKREPAVVEMPQSLPYTQSR